MLVCLLLVCCVLCVLGVAKSQDLRFSSKEIVYTEAHFHRSTAMVVEAINHVDVLCTGNLLSSRWVLSAAICVFDSKCKRIDKNMIRVYTGYSTVYKYVHNLPDVKGQKRDVQLIETHPSFVCNGYDEDNLALLKLHSELDSDYVSYATLATQPLKFGYPHVCSVTGFGRDIGPKGRYNYSIDSGGVTIWYTYWNCRIKEREVRVWRRCSCFFTGKGKSHSKLVRAPLICDHNNHNSETFLRFAFEDLGAGLICNGKLFGVLSGVLNSTFYDTCGRKSAVNIRNLLNGQEMKRHTIYFTNLCTHLQWVSKVTNEEVMSMRTVEKDGCGELGKRFSAYSRLNRKQSYLYNPRGLRGTGSHTFTLTHFLLLLPTVLFIQ